MTAGMWFTIAGVAAGMAVPAVLGLLMWMAER